MARTNHTNVSGIIEIDTGITTDAALFIDTAGVLVDQLVADAETAAGDAYYSESTDSMKLEIIERWLAAHFYAMRDPRFTFEKSVTEEVRYQSKIGFNLALSHYGQKAMVLDTSGWLSRLNEEITSGKARSVQVTWLGTGAGNEPTTGTASGF